MGKYAVMINANTDDSHTGSCANGLEYALDLDENGHEVDLYFDGAATKWIRRLENDQDHVVHKYYKDARDRDLVAGACKHCAEAYGVADDVEEAGLPLFGGGNYDHGPHAGDLVDEGYELLTVG